MSRSVCALGVALACLFFGAAFDAAAADEDLWQVVIIKPPDCYFCVLLEQSLKRQGYLREVPLADGHGSSIRAVIERRPSGTLSAEELGQVGKLPYFNARQWKQQGQSTAQILLKHNGEVVSAGAIEDSLDLRESEFPSALTLPSTSASYQSIRDGYSDWYRDTYLRELNLDYFFQLARDPDLSRSRSLEAWLARQPPRSPAAPAAKVNVLLMATASGVLDNQIFNLLRIDEVRRDLTEEAHLQPEHFKVFYGNGNEPGANTLEVRDGRVLYTRHEIRDARPLQLRNLASVFEQLHSIGETHNLLVLIGHGGPTGAPTWGEPAGLRPDDLAALHRLGGGDDILVSGNCYGGVMAQATSCGFFGARPDIIATGCQADAAQVAQSQDYIHAFFDGFSSAGRAEADADHDGDVSFEEAHWYATVHGDPRNVTYSSVDGLADEWFDAHPESLPASLSLGEIRQLAVTASAAERSALAALSASLPDSHVVDLRDLAGQATRWIQKPEGPRPVLGQLARRLLYSQRFGSRDPVLAQARSCGERSIKAFLQH